MFLTGSLGPGTVRRHGHRLSSGSGLYVSHRGRAASAQLSLFSVALHLQPLSASPSILHPSPPPQPPALTLTAYNLWRVQSYPLAGVLALLTGDPCAVGPADLRRCCWCESAERRHWACVKMEGEKKNTQNMCKLMTVYVFLFNSIF